QHGLPQVLRVDNGPEFLGEPFTHWADAEGMTIRYIQPEKLNQKADVERFNRTLREELLDPQLFASLDDVRETLYWWMLEYNEHRPHTALKDQTAIEVRHQSARCSTFNLST
ncbi:MAG: integrase core domain-containing protein, partial [Steroidobacteraceae bacterium]